MWAGSSRIQSAGTGRILPSAARTQLGVGAGETIADFWTALCGDLCTMGMQLPDLAKELGCHVRN
jgi:hypothetical protein